MARKSSIKPRFILRTLEDSVPALDQQLLTAYLETEYRIGWPAGKWTALKINQTNAPYFLALENAGTTQFAIITAYNPYSELLDDQTNMHQNKLLESELAKAERVSYYPTLHVAASGDWPPEKGYCCCDIEAATAVALGKKFGQNALVWWKSGNPLELWWL